ncbi:hypothetical protein ACPPVQ_15935 [Diaminobutyricibacter sp. McL0618]|uniref:hypothetical protein n=1 Tax=Leifsonia sp. McL0618 TaxID=3415677 RepID=UPI003CE9A7C4
MPAYARILNPVDAYHLSDDHEAIWRWADVAARNNVRLDSASEWRDITANGTADAWPDGWQARWPDEGRIDPALLASFVPALRSHTARPDEITVAVWEGWGFGASSVALYTAFDDEAENAPEPIPDPIEQKRQATDPRLEAMDRFESGAYERAMRGEVREFGEPRFDLPARRYALGSTSLDELARPDWPHHAGLGWAPDDETGIMPQLIWPADETWCLSIEVDAPYTVVAGPRELVRELLALPGIEGQAIREPRYS